jgi:hypothetical protein
MQNFNCDGSGPHTDGQVRVMAISSHGNLILCRACWNRELAWRKQRNRELEAFAQFELPAFDAAKVYES